MKLLCSIRLIICCLVCFISYLTHGQETTLQKIKRSTDSIITNPNYSYKLLTELRKNERDHDSVKAMIQLKLGGYFNDIGVVDSSLFYTKKSLIHLKNQKSKAQAYRILGSCYRRSGKIDDAITMLFKSLQICEAIDSKKITSTVKSDLGILYTEKNDFEKALRFLKESIAIATNPQAIYGNYVNIGTIYFFQEDLDNAEDYYTKALNLIPPGKDPKVLATILLNLGSVLMKKNKLKEALGYFEKSKQVADANGFVDKSLNAIEHKALIYDAMGNHKKAIEMLTTALVPAQEISSLFTQKNIYENLANIYTKINNYKAANTALNAFYQLKDSINHRVQRDKIMELEVKYETVKKNQEISKLKETQILKNEELKRERLIKKVFLIGFLIILIPISILLFVYYQKLQVTKKFNEQKSAIHKEKIGSFLKQKELELANTYVIAQNEERERIARELHDSIGGNLAAIKLQMVDLLKNKGLKSTIVGHLDDTYQQVREISHNLTPKKISQTTFTHYVDDYIKTIEKVVDTSITFVPHPEKEVNVISDPLKVEIFKILQELLTNAVKHAKAKNIEICLNTYKDRVEILFDDNGVGFDLKKQTEGIGLQNIRQRLAILIAKIDIDTLPNRGTAIRIEIPYTDV